MTARRKPTVAGLTRTLAAEQERHKGEVDDLHAQIDSARQEVKSLDFAANNRDPEALAVDVCAKALDRLNAGDRNRDTFRATTYGAVTTVTLPPVGRVLEYLRRRYGIPDAVGQVEHLTRRVNELTAELDQARTHLDDVRRAADGSSRVWP